MVLLNTISNRNSGDKKEDSQPNLAPRRQTPAENLRKMSYYLFLILAMLSVFNVQLLTEAFRVLPTQKSIRCNLISERKNKSCKVILFSEGNGNEKKIKKLDTIAEPSEIEDLPIFSLEYNADNVDYSKLPVPPFTSALIFFVSTAFTIYLYYVGITGGVATDPKL